MKSDIHEEYLYVQSELSKELRSAAIAIDSEISNLEQKKIHRLPEVSILTRGELISRLTERLLILEKYLQRSSD